MINYAEVYKEAVADLQDKENPIRKMAATAIMDDKLAEGVFNIIMSSPLALSAVFDMQATALTTQTFMILGFVYGYKVAQAEGLDAMLAGIERATEGEES
jgi:hypothetical protein